MPQKTTWTEALDNTLRARWAAGCTTRQIAAELGLTKNQVIGRARRIGVSGNGGSHPRESQIGASATNGAKAKALQANERDRRVLAEMQTDCDRGRVLRSNGKLADAAGLTAGQVENAMRAMRHRGDIVMWMSRNRRLRQVTLADGRKSADPRTSSAGAADPVKAARVQGDPTRAWSADIAANMAAYGTQHRPRGNMSEEQMPRPWVRECQFIDGEPSPDDDCKCRQPAFAGAWCREHAKLIWHRRLKDEELV